ncbi:hypothetical protein AB0I28_32800 [Phytomonospora sp. NPDC050363]|uniref:hypothetical protein n=1 Tax=Phytomonospora sp. NPDC050363 TaxID=3155642 RepID=UPI0033D00AEB
MNTHPIVSGIVPGDTVTFAPGAWIGVGEALTEPMALTITETHRPTCYDEIEAIGVDGEGLPRNIFAGPDHIAAVERRLTWRTGAPAPATTRDAVDAARQALLLSTGDTTTIDATLVAWLTGQAEALGYHVEHEPAPGGTFGAVGYDPAATTITLAVEDDNDGYTVGEAHQESAELLTAFLDILGEISGDPGSQIALLHTRTTATTHQS